MNKKQRKANSTLDMWRGVSQSRIFKLKITGARLIKIQRFKIIIKQCMLQDKREM